MSKAPKALLWYRIGIGCRWHPKSSFGIRLEMDVDGSDVDSNRGTTFGIGSKDDVVITQGSSFGSRTKIYVDGTQD